MALLKQLSQYIWGPRLYATTVPYQPYRAEVWGDRCLSLLHFICRYGIYGSPFIGIYVMKREPQILAGQAMKLAMTLGIAFCASYCLRLLGRASNPVYRRFALALFNEKSELLRKYDYDFYAFPLDFDAAFDGKGRRDFDALVKRPSGILVSIAGSIAVSTFGLSLIYPGATSILNVLVAKQLLESRLKLIADGGQRNKIRTIDGNDIDTMFFDRRNSTLNGSILVIASEGNAGFYEVGIMTTPIEGGYSTLGWNHPGFGHSTGRPYPDQEHRAIDAVMQYAINKLGFAEENIVLYGWSIGCYSVAWAAARYPNVRALFLDATFDDILPLAMSRMPPILEPIVEEVVRNHVNLNISELLEKYDGPISLVRRTSDEIICVEEGRLSTNRINDLIFKLIKHRHPKLLENDRDELLRLYLNNKLASELPRTIAGSFPGDPKLNLELLTLLESYLADYNSTHCTPLPVEYFRIANR